LQYKSSKEHGLFGPRLEWC